MCTLCWNNFVFQMTNYKSETSLQNYYKTSVSMNKNNGK